MGVPSPPLVWKVMAPVEQLYRGATKANDPVEGAGAVVEVGGAVVVEIGEVTVVEVGGATFVEVGGAVVVVPQYACLDQV
jgi:hypothetical protein